MWSAEDLARDAARQASCRGCVTVGRFFALRWAGERGRPWGSPQRPGRCIVEFRDPATRGAGYASPHQSSFRACPACRRSIRARTYASALGVYSRTTPGTASATPRRSVVPP